MGSGISKKYAPSQDGTVLIHTDKSVYLPGDQVSGSIYLQTSSPCPPSQLILRLNAIEGSHRVVNSNKSKHLDENFRKFIQSTWVLHQWDSEIAPGHVEIPFSFMLPNDIPASFHQEGITFVAYIIYMLEVTLEPISKKELKLSPIYQYQKLIIRKPVNRVAKSHDEEIRVPLSTWCCIPRGFLGLRAYFEKDLYSPGDVLRVAVEIDNSLGNQDNTETQVQLMQKLNLNAITYDLTIASRTIPNVKAKTKSGPQMVNFEVPVFRGDEHSIEARATRWPRGRSDGSAGKLGLTTQGKFVSSEFYLQVVCKMSGVNVRMPKIVCPIDICYPERGQQPLKLPEDWCPEVLEKNNLGLVTLGKIKKTQIRGELNKETMVETQMALV